MIEKDFNSKKDIIFTDKIIIWKKTKNKLKEVLEVTYEIEKYNSSNIPNNYFNTLLEVANDWFGIQMWLEDIKNHIYKSDEVFLLKINWAIIWFSSISNLDNFIYRFWTVIKNKYQNNWLYTILNQVIFNKSKKYFVRTQNQNVIKALQDSFDLVLYWKEALISLEKEWLTKNKISKFMLKQWDKEETLCEKWIFNWVYGWKMWDKTRVDYIDDKFYSWFNSEKWDSLLVIYMNKY